MDQSHYAACRRYQYCTTAIYKGGFVVHSSVFHFVPCVSRSCLGYGYEVQLNERFVNIGVVAIRTSLRQSHHNELVYKLLLASNWPLQNNDHDTALFLLYNCIIPYIYIYIYNCTLYSINSLKNNLHLFTSIFSLSTKQIPLRSFTVMYIRSYILCTKTVLVNSINK